MSPYYKSCWWLKPNKLCPQLPAGKNSFSIGENLNFLSLFFRVGFIETKHKSLQGIKITHWRLKYWHLLINHFKNELQEVKGKVNGFAEISRETMIN
jgi:hypothetical protein